MVTCMDLGQKEGFLSHRDSLWLRSSHDDGSVHYGALPNGRRNCQLILILREFFQLLSAENSVKNYEEYFL